MHNVYNSSHMQIGGHISRCNRQSTGGCFAAVFLLFGGCFATIVVQETFAPLAILVSFSMFSWVVVSRFVGLSEFPPPLFLLFLLGLESPATRLVVLCNRLNSLCLLRFVSVVFLSS